MVGASSAPQWALTGGADISRFFSIIHPDFFCFFGEMAHVDTASLSAGAKHGLLGFSKRRDAFPDCAVRRAISLIALHVIAPTALRVSVLVSVFGGAPHFVFFFAVRSCDSLPTRLKVRCAMSCIAARKCTCTLASDTACLFFRCFGRRAHAKVAVCRRARASRCLCTCVCVCAFFRARVSAWVRAILISEREKNSLRRRVGQWQLVRPGVGVARRHNGFSSCAPRPLCCSFGVSTLSLLFRALCTRPG
jgi:hypothetical protein